MTSKPRPARLKKPRQRPTRLVIPSMTLGGLHGQALHLPVLRLSPLEPEDADA